MSALKKMLIALAVVAAILAAIPLVLPYDSYKSDIEHAISARLDTPVAIGAIQFSYSPKPQVVLSGLSLGKQGEGEIDKVIVPLTLKNLINIRHELANVSLEGGNFSQAFALSLPGRLKPNAGQDINFAMLKLSEMTIKLPNDSIGPLSGSLQFNPEGTIKVLTLSDKDERATLTIKPIGDKFELEFDASNWVMPGAYPDARFDQLRLSGIASNDGIAIDDINALIFGSAVKGNAQLSWTEGWKLTGSLQTKSIQVEPLIMLSSQVTRATGRMAANAIFDFVGDGYENLFKQRRIEMKFIVNDGNLHNFDLVTPLKSQSPSSLQRGGITRFDTLSGDFLLENDTLTLRNLALNAGKFTAAGGLNIAADQKLSGRINAKLSSGAIAVNAPLAIAGTLRAPEIRSGGAYKPGGGSGTTQIF
ncbi:hypothetical protein FNU76_16680 [Chitinimonas arctica]|uniref:Uncharacterized protein n=1 Tax=Chitinimonas arctica TaxID=2594795 RepID=A0A516SI62_9NEIS|nr:AsmA-like C-terminal region-containing protein [Chitinimonas arctica]QDQ27849.1 hypothetical protein FNU76_16680 [Chitinimonas arctica]